MSSTERCSCVLASNSMTARRGVVMRSPRARSCSRMGNASCGRWSIMMLGSVLVTVEDVGVRVRVFVDEIHRAQQRAVGQHFGGRSLRDEPVLLAEDDTAVGDLPERREVVGRE